MELSIYSTVLYSPLHNSPLWSLIEEPLQRISFPHTQLPSSLLEHAPHIAFPQIRWFSSRMAYMLFDFHLIKIKQTFNFFSSSNRYTHNSADLVWTQIVSRNLVYARCRGDWEWDMIRCVSRRLNSWKRTKISLWHLQFAYLNNILAINDFLYKKLKKNS